MKLIELNERTPDPIIAAACGFLQASGESLIPDPRTVELAPLSDCHGCALGDRITIDPNRVHYRNAQSGDLIGLVGFWFTKPFTPVAKAS